jgi:hypothetical protein
MRGAVSLLGIVFAISSGNTVAGDDSPTISWSTGLEFSSGTYGGSDDIEDLYLPMKGRLNFDRVSFDLTVPYLSVRAPAFTTISGPGGEAVPGSGELVTESGLGDIIAGITIYDVAYSEELDIALDLAGKIKFGTADETRGLGTGKQDFTVRADLYKFFEQFTLLTSAGYKLRGDPADIDLDNVLLGSFGGVYLPSDNTSLGLIYDYRESALIDGDAISELSAFTSRQIGDRWAVQFYAFTGFSDSSADWGAGIQFKLAP